METNPADFEFEEQHRLYDMQRLQHLAEQIGRIMTRRRIGNFATAIGGLRTFVTVKIEKSE